MVALRRFLVDASDFSINDFTLSHWGKLEALGLAWEGEARGEATRDFDWGDVLPFLDVWLDVPIDQVHYVQPLLPTLDWNGESIGVRLRYEPKDFGKLKQEYLAARSIVTNTLGASSPAEESPRPDAYPAGSADSGFSLWPRSFVDFLSRHIGKSAFEVHAYLLDPTQRVSPRNGVAVPQRLPPHSEPIKGDPFLGLIRIDEIGAQRGFGFATSTSQGDDEEQSEKRSGRRLSVQLRNYYSRHLDPYKLPQPQDVAAMQAVFAAQVTFGKRMAEDFSSAFAELESIGYPGITDPKLTIRSNIKPVDGIRHPSAVQYQVPTFPGADALSHHLPEDSNGLGYQNLISIVFELMSFRDRWMKVGKASASDDLVAPLHLVLIEEPEAHLHAQVQQVFINNAYAVLRRHDVLGKSKELRTQLVISTHSSHIAHEAEFGSLRYFRRLPASAVAGAVPFSAVVNLSEVFGSEVETERFVKRYIKATHCDLFFADGVVLVEGPAERILVPHLIRTDPVFADLRRCYLTWLEIGGSHAHRLKPLLLHLGLNTLIITDIDAKEAKGEAKVAVLKRGAGYRTRNQTLKTWIPGEELLDTLLDAKPEHLLKQEASGYAVRVAYQQPVLATVGSAQQSELLPNTFEDAFLYENLSFFAQSSGTGLLADFAALAKDSTNVAELAEGVFKALASGSKAELALELLGRSETDAIKIPSYIRAGLVWLMAQLKRNALELTAPESTNA